MIRPKYNQGTLQTKWRIAQCQGEKVYFKFKKDCATCDGKTYCFTRKFKPYGVEIHEEVLVFAETGEDAKQFGSKGHGFKVFPERRKGNYGFPYKVEREGDKLHIGIGEKE